METKLLIWYLLSSFSISILYVLYLQDIFDKSPHSPIYLHNNTVMFDYKSSPSASDKVWPELEFNWRITMATVVGFLGSAFGTVGGVGGGGIFVPLLTLVVGFDTKSAAALSKCMIMGASTSSVWYNLRVPHPTKEVPIIDYDLALLFQPMLMLGITIGVSLSLIFPYFLVTLLIIILFLATSSRSFFKGIDMWKEETIVNKQRVDPGGENLIQLVPKVEKSDLQILCFNLKLKKTLVLLFVWVCFLILQVFKNDTHVCSPWYVGLFLLQFPLAFGMYGHEAVKLYRENKRRNEIGITEYVCGASIQWTVVHLSFCALCGIVGGTVGGLLGSGGGFILGPLLLEIGVIPQVASATATFVMMFSSSLSVAEFYLLKRFPIPFALYLIAVSILAGFWGQCFIRKLVAFLKRASLIVFILSAVIFASALTMGIIGTKRSIQMLRNHEFMGFLNLCVAP